MAAKVTSEAVSSAVQSLVGKKPPFRLGGKKLYLPNHVVTFLRPKPGQSPMKATFEVPLTFNKFDLRDYLYHVYNVEITSVRSFINQKRLEQRNMGDKFTGPWYRPRSQKLMIVDLVKPFVWPERPAEKDMTAWDHQLFMTIEDGHEEELSRTSKYSSWGPQRLRMTLPTPRDKKEVRKDAVQYLTGKKKWVPGMRGLAETESIYDAPQDERHEALAAETIAAEAEAAKTDKVNRLEESQR